jgi:hypothetical protein
MWTTLILKVRSFLNSDVKSKWDMVNGYIGVPKKSRVNSDVLHAQVTSQNKESTYDRYTTLLQL